MTFFDLLEQVKRDFAATAAALSRLLQLQLLRWQQGRKRSARQTGPYFLKEFHNFWQCAKEVPCAGTTKKTLWNQVQLRAKPSVSWLLVISNEAVRKGWILTWEPMPVWNMMVSKGRELRGDQGVSLTASALCIVLSKGRESRSAIRSTDITCIVFVYSPLLNTPYKIVYQIYTWWMFLSTALVHINKNTEHLMIIDANLKLRVANCFCRFREFIRARWFRRWERTGWTCAADCM